MTPTAYPTRRPSAAPPSRVRGRLAADAVIARYVGELAAGAPRRPAPDRLRGATHRSHPARQ